MPLGDIEWHHSVVFPGDFSSFDDEHLTLMLRAISHEDAKRAVSAKGGLGTEEVMLVEDSPVFETSATTVGGRRLSVHDLIKRVLRVYSDPTVSHVSMGHSIFLVTKSAPLFHQKAMLTPGGTFVCGASTLERVLTQKDVYSNRVLRDGLEASLESMKAQGCRFVVGEGRDKDKKGREAAVAVAKFKDAVRTASISIPMRHSSS